MLPTFIVIAGIILLWSIFLQRKLTILDESVSNAMREIGVQLSSIFDALTALLDLSKSYAESDSEKLIEMMKIKRNVITAKSIPDDVVLQEKLIQNILQEMTAITEKYPALKTESIYIKVMDTVESHNKIIRTSHMIYNNRVVKFNREIRNFPVFMIARLLGFRQRKYLEE